ncbi:hypothetical protein [Fischerella sp. PCC 9605]
MSREQMAEHLMQLTRLMMMKDNAFRYLIKNKILSDLSDLKL